MGDKHRMCEIPDSISLEDLTNFILDSFDFDNDHLHQLFIGRLPRP